ncbi:mitogen-activated protein kinase kinase [Malassezia sp. CBS 17886]|nr:mitogen-activated protein kinase kinase [Malassezia sp. CBS 17886]
MLTQAVPDAEQPETHGLEEITIMPHNAHFAQPRDSESCADELQRVLGGIALQDAAPRCADNLSLHRLSSSSYEGSDPPQSSQRVSSASSPTPDRQDRGTPAMLDPQDLRTEDDLEVLASLGEGASGEVAKARVKSTGQIIARKTITTSPDPMIHRQLLRELNVNRSCQSEFIVQYYNAFFEPSNATITICMEFCEAGSMDAIYKQVRQRGGRVGEKVLMKLAECVLKGLVYLHERRIIHRDVKPSNILVTRAGQVKLCDFGVAGELVDSVAGTFTGTSSYMAPERIQGLPYTITSDVWSLGISILELASNRFPFPADADVPLCPIDLITFLLHAPLPALKDDEAKGIKWSRALRDFLDRCLVRDGTARAGPRALVKHPVVKRSEGISSSVMARFVANVWLWEVPGDDAYGTRFANNQGAVTAMLTYHFRRKTSAARGSSQARNAPAQCPIPHDERSGAAAASGSGLNPLNKMPSLTQERAPRQTLDLPRERTVSSIPRAATSAAPGEAPYGTEEHSAGGQPPASCPMREAPAEAPAACPMHQRDAKTVSAAEQSDNWEYPSPQQFYNALVRKGWETPEESVEMMVLIHNFLNERAWQEVVDWETRAGSDPSRLQLARFQGRPGTMSPHAYMHQLLAWAMPDRFDAEPPFDRHDWIVRRAPTEANPEGEEIRYVIDYYSAPEDDDEDEASFSLDVRPALDSLGSLRVRMQKAWEEYKSGELLAPFRGAAEAERGPADAQAA